jgi:hypothetical protein
MVKDDVVKDSGIAFIQGRLDRVKASREGVREIWHKIAMINQLARCWKDSHYEMADLVGLIDANGPVKCEDLKIDRCR